MRTSWSKPSTTGPRSTSTPSWPATTGAWSRRGPRARSRRGARGEELNFLALNLANDICTGSIDADKARLQYTEIKAAFGKGDRHPYTQGLQFEVAEAGTADPDVQTMEEQG